MCAQNQSRIESSSDPHLARVALLAALTMGVAGAAGSAASQPTATDWPQTASQVLATLMIAVAVEQSFFRLLFREAVVRSMLVWVWIAVALLTSVIAAINAQAFEAWEAAVVGGAITMLVGVVTFVAMLSEPRWLRRRLVSRCAGEGVSLAELLRASSMSRPRGGCCGLRRWRGRLAAPTMSCGDASRWASAGRQPHREPSDGPVSSTGAGLTVSLPPCMAAFGSCPSGGGFRFSAC
jgi:hypothetical protein